MRASGIISRRLVERGLFFLALFLFPPPLHGQTAVYERTQLVFGDVALSIRVETGVPRDAAFREIEKGFAIAKRQNEMFSTFDPASEISRLNALPKPAKGVRVSREMADVIADGLRFTKLTNGFFDVTFEMMTSGADAIRPRGKRKLDLLAPDLRVNPTGLVKGDTVDRILALFKRNRRIHSALVAAGGDIGRFDRGGTEGTIPLHNPVPQKSGGRSVSLVNGAVSTSGQYERGAHVKNTRRSAVEHLQTSVIAPDCTTSDALATAFLFMPVADIRKTLKSFPGTRAIVYEKNGTVIEP